MLSKLLHLKDGELPRLWPFFTLYLILFSALTLSDGLSLALFVQRVGVGHLPFAYGAIAVLNLAAVVFYFFRAENAGSTRVFFHILLSTFATFFMAWSLVVPLVAILMNLLSVGAAYGLMVLVFQHGFGVGLLGFQQTDVIDA